ncbi:hypothetical protein BMR07_15230 [Methylococcaceae bacterium CS1]|nr:hypothetical protein BMR11_15145 [Methylococcaceae bacterium CS5]TXK95253.1 hypothetical protein BMR10_10765 [Methylococcaceae bacterium CS4]TXL03429.1 hypothetical protein BMR07_15230 [Methylococcaceae bacterium CS1]TXL03787.1 hypothetical protein BMR09_14125 [Methylococcaceae bacterium CS3]TXL06041.1 hypothetical protein BMR08_15675 [Methylococcaceae bacterium CS2]
MTIKTILFVIAIELFTLRTAYSNEEHAAFNGDVLAIGMVDFLEEQGKVQDVTFKFKEGNEWVLLGYTMGSEITREMESVELIKKETFPTQVFIKISGTFSSGCGSVGKISHKRIDNNFNISVYYGNYNPSEVICTQGFHSFTRIIPLPVYSLKEGNYSYTVNGNFTGTFNLSSDNELEVAEQ